jgi:hypothetical protein
MQAPRTRRVPWPRRDDERHARSVATHIFDTGRAACLPARPAETGGRQHMALGVSMAGRQRLQIETPHHRKNRVALLPMIE